MRRPLIALSTATAVALAASGTFAAAAGTSTASITFTTKKAKASTGLGVSITPAPGADGKALILTDVKLTLPKGTKFATKATTACALSDKEITDMGGPVKACPPKSKVGSGTADAFIGETPAKLGIALFNAPEGGKDYLLLDLQINGASAYTVTGAIKANTVDFALTRAKELNARATKIDFKIKAAGTAKKPFITTPSSCPKTGKLKATTALTYSDGAEKINTTIACAKPKN